MKKKDDRVIDRERLVEHARRILKSNPIKPDGSPDETLIAAATRFLAKGAHNV